MRLITTESTLTKELTTFKASYTKAHSLAHVLAVSCLAHAAKHGNPEYLNVFHKTLATNDQTALRLYVRRVFAVLGGWDGTTQVEQSEMEDFKSRGAFMVFEKGAFRVLRNDEHEHSKAAKAKMARLALVIINPDGKVWKPFLERNNLSEIKTVGDDEVRSAVKALIKRASGDKDGTKSTVSAGVLASLKRLASDIHLDLAA